MKGVEKEKSNKGRSDGRSSSDGYNLSDISTIGR